ncbi:unnamed protein product [Camellia sinensis]
MFTRSSQVLFSEQVKMKAAMQGKEQTARGDNSDHEDSTSSMKEIKILKAELEEVQLKMQELQTDYTELQRQYDKLKHKHCNLLGWTFGWRKIKNSGFFNGKIDGDETEEGQERYYSRSQRVSLHQRLLSIS